MMDWKSVENELLSTSNLLLQVEDSVSDISSKNPFDLNSKILNLKNSISKNLNYQENLLKRKQKQNKIKEHQAKSKKISSDYSKSQIPSFPFTDFQFFLHFPLCPDR